MKTTCCIWCHTPVKVRDTFDDLQQKAVCSVGCRDAETLFEIMFSDEEINRRNHYQELTKGKNHD